MNSTSNEVLGPAERQKGESLESRLVDLTKAAREFGARVRKIQSCIDQLSKAADSGVLLQVRRGLAELNPDAKALAIAAHDMSEVWWSQEREAEYLRSSLAAEVITTAAARGLAWHIDESDCIVAAPVTARVNPLKCSVSIGKAVTTSLRPGLLCDFVKSKQEAGPFFAPPRLFDCLRTVYAPLNGLAGEPWLPLLSAYEAITVLPEAKRSYPVEQFAIDLAALVASGLRIAGSVRLELLNASTSARAGKGVAVRSSAGTINLYAFRFMRHEDA